MKQRIEAKTVLFGYSKKRVNEIIEEQNAEFLSKIQAASMDKINGLNEMKSDCDSKIAAIEDELKKLKKENEELRIKNTGLQNEMAASVEKDRNEYSQLYSNYSILEAELALRIEEVEVLQSEYTEKTKETEALIAEIIRLKEMKKVPLNDDALSMEEAKNVTENLVKSSAQFDKYFLDMRENVKKLSELFNSTEQLFDNTFFNVADFLLNLSSDKSDESDSSGEDEDKTESEADLGAVSNEDNTKNFLENETEEDNNSKADMFFQVS